MVVTTVLRNAPVAARPALKRMLALLVLMNIKL